MFYLTCHISDLTKAIHFAIDRQTPLLMFCSLHQMKILVMVVQDKSMSGDPGILFHFVALLSVSECKNISYVTSFRPIFGTVCVSVVR